MARIWHFLNRIKRNPKALARRANAGAANQKLMFGVCRSQQLRRVLIITLPFGERVRTRTVRHSAWCRCHPRSWSRMMTSSRSRTTTCADTGMAVASVAGAAAHSTTIFISASSVSPGLGETRESQKCFLKQILGDAFLAPVRRLLGGTRLVHMLSQRIKESVFRKRRSNQRTLSKITAHHDQRLQICDRIDAPATALLSNRCARSMAV